MSPNTLTQPESKTSSMVESELIALASHLNDEQRAAMEVAESARETRSTRESFAGQLFTGRLDLSAVTPFPTQTEDDQRIGDEIVRKVTAFLEKHLDPDEVDESRTIPVEVIAGLREMGIFRMKVPAEYGGLGFSQVNYNRVLQAIASYCSSTAVLISAHQSIGTPQPLKMFGTDAQKKKYLTRISRGELSAFALTEPEVGSDPARLGTTAEPSEDGSHYVINGDKLWTTNGPIAQQLVVMARTPPKVRRGREKRQITAFIVEMDSPGIEVLHRCDFMGLRAIHNGVIRFHDVKVPAENILWGEGMGLRLALATLNTGRLTLPAACTGMGKQCLSIARQWGRQREQWGQPIGRHEAGSEKIADIAATTFAMDAVTQLTSHWADEQRDIRIEAAMAKLFCSEASWRIVDETMQLRGGRGYERALSLRSRGETAWPVERLMRDCRINRIIEGTTEIMRLFIAREALDPHLQHVSALLNADVYMVRRLLTGLRIMGSYLRWYPQQFVPRPFVRRHRSYGALARHMRFVERTSHRLARAIFHAMLRHRQKLDQRQLLLAHLVEIGTELFVMTATCAYAQSALSAPGDSGPPNQLADLFCEQARRRIHSHFRDLRADLRPMNALAGRILDGDFRWMEEGIIPIAPAA